MVAGAGGNESHCFLLRKLKVVNAHLSSCFLLCIQLRTPARGAVPTIFRMGLPTSVYLVWKIPHRHVQKMCLLGASVKLTITLICHRGKLLELRVTLKSTAASGQWLPTFCVLLLALKEAQRRVLVWSF